jgi:hypothetical protein
MVVESKSFSHVIPEKGHLIEEESQEKLNTLGSANVFMITIFGL